MAVPKQKQSHSRTNKRRSQHKLPVRQMHLCGRCNEPVRPHRVCGECGFYGDREVTATDPMSLG